MQSSISLLSLLLGRGVSLGQREDILLTGQSVAFPASRNSTSQVDELQVVYECPPYLPTQLESILGPGLPLTFRLVARIAPKALNTATQGDTDRQARTV
jgi:hypothetical protein